MTSQGWLIILWFEMVTKKKNNKTILFSHYSVKQMKYLAFYCKMDFGRWLYTGLASSLWSAPLSDTDRYLLGPCVNLEQAALHWQGISAGKCLLSLHQRGVHSVPHTLPASWPRVHIAPIPKRYVKRLPLLSLPCCLWAGAWTLLRVMLPCCSGTIFSGVTLVYAAFL